MERGFLLACNSGLFFIDAEYLHNGISRVMVGKYEREEAIPSIEVAKKIAQAFEVTLDYICGEGISTSFDKKTIKRIQQIEDLPENDSPPLAGYY